MDTRAKIIDAARLEEVQRNGRLRIVSGYFDVLLAEHVRRLREIRAADPGATLVVALRIPPDPLLDARARAELVAALEMVDYVVLDDLGGDVIAEEQMRAELIAHVHRRQSQ